MNSLVIYSTAISALLITLSLSTTVFAEPPSAGDEYAEASPGLATPKEIMSKDAANVVCNGSLCTLFSVSVNKKTFTISSYASVGSSNQNLGSNNNYYGFTPSTNTNATSGGSIQPNYGVQISWDNTHCTKNVDVDKSVYDSVTTYMRELVNKTPGEDPTYPQFTPAEETMILFYTTVMDLTKGATCN